MRAHIEQVVGDDLIDHDVRLPGGDGVAKERFLSRDEENDAATTVVTFDTAWQRPPGYHDADTEWFVLSGSVRLGDQQMAQGGYWRAPSGIRVPQLEVDAGTAVLMIRDGAGPGFTPSEADRSTILTRGVSSRNGLPGELNISVEPQWMPNPLAGDCGPHGELDARVLYYDPPPIAPGHESLGASSLLLRFPVGWINRQFEHHSCWQELYVLTGVLEYNYGRLARGFYVHSPALVKHGGARVVSSGPVMAFVRYGGLPEHWVTDDPSVSQLGRPLNWNPRDPYESPIVAGLPQRTASVGAWSGEIK